MAAAGFDTTGLDEFSAEAGRLLLRVFPHWAELFQRRSADDGSAYLYISLLPPPTSGLPSGIWLTTSGREITVGFGALGLHSHFSAFNGVAAAAADASAQVAGILVDAIVAATTWHDGQVIDEATGSIDDPAFQQFVLHRPPRPGSVRRIRSWTGRRDLDIPGAGA